MVNQRVAVVGEAVAEARVANRAVSSAAFSVLWVASRAKISALLKASNSSRVFSGIIVCSASREGESSLGVPFQVMTKLICTIFVALKLCTYVR